MIVIYGVILIIAIQSLGIWSNLIGFLLFLSLLGICIYLNPYEIKKELDDREKNLYVFTDFDDSGLLIQNNFLNQMRKHLKIHFNNVERIALTKDLIEKYSIPQNPTKESTHKKYNLPYYVELDALEPNVLTDLVKEVCEKNYDKDLYNAISKTFRYRNRRMKKNYFRQLRQIDLSTI